MPVLKLGHAPRLDLPLKLVNPYLSAYGSTPLPAPTKSKTYDDIFESNGLSWAFHSPSIAQVSLAWVLSKDVVPIPGTRHVSHLEANWAANGLVLDADAIAELEAGFTRGSTVGARYPADGLKLVPPEPVAA